MFMYLSLDFSYLVFTMNNKGHEHEYGGNENEYVYTMVGIVSIAGVHYS